MTFRSRIGEFGPATAQSNAQLLSTHHAWIRSRLQDTMSLPEHLLKEDNAFSGRLRADSRRVGALHCRGCKWEGDRSSLPPAHKVLIIRHCWLAGIIRTRRPWSHHLHRQPHDSLLDTTGQYRDFFTFLLDVQGEISLLALAAEPGRLARRKTVSEGIFCLRVLKSACNALLMSHDSLLELDALPSADVVKSGTRPR